jgi:hypothetical protein
MVEEGILTQAEFDAVEGAAASIKVLSDMSLMGDSSSHA